MPPSKLTHSISKAFTWSGSVVALILGIVVLSFTSLALHNTVRCQADAKKLNKAPGTDCDGRIVLILSVTLGALVCLGALMVIGAKAHVAANEGHQ